MTEEHKGKANGSGNGAESEEKKQEFAIQKIYVKDISFESPNTPDIFSEKWEPDISLEINTAGKGLAPETHEVVLTVTVSAKLGEKTAYLVEAQQAGIFTIHGLNDQELSHALGSYCPNILFPYLREVVSELIAKGGFPQLLLSPVNFDALYAQHMQRMQEETSDVQQPVSTH